MQDYVKHITFCFYPEIVLRNRQKIVTDRNITFCFYPEIVLRNRQKIVTDRNPLIRGTQRLFRPKYIKENTF